jgi:GNAT superfamily N-acetyltransferase
MLYEKNENGYLFSNDKGKLQTDVIHNFLSKESYWAADFTKEMIEAYIERSDCFGIYAGKQQVGFARVITDGVVLGYVMDVFVLREHRGRGLSKLLMRFVLDYKPYKTLKKLMLRTSDAHGLYSQFGFTVVSDPQNLMELKPFESLSH